MTEDIQFTVWDKEAADVENEKLLAIQKLLDNAGLEEEDLTLITEAIHEGAKDALADAESKNDENTDSVPNAL